MSAPCGVLAIFVLLLFAAAPASGVAAQQDVREIARDVLADGAYQKRLREAPEPPPPRSRPDARRGDDAHGGNRGGGAGEGPFLPPAGTSPAADGGLSFTRLVLLLIVALVAAWAVLGIVAAIRERRERATRPGPDEHTPDAAAGGAAPPCPFEQLAAAGRFAEAAHVMLMLVIEHHRALTGKPVSPSTTGRELLRALPRSDAERAGLKRLVATVEVSLFGGRAVSADGYEACLDAYRGLVA